MFLLHIILYTILLMNNTFRHVLCSAQLFLCELLINPLFNSHVTSLSGLCLKAANVYYLVRSFCEYCLMCAHQVLPLICFAFAICCGVLFAVRITMFSRNALLPGGWCYVECTRSAFYLKLLWVVFISFVEQDHELNPMLLFLWADAVLQDK